jgi:hypothetical protein
LQATLPQPRVGPTVGGGRWAVGGSDTTVVDYRTGGPR